MHGPAWTAEEDNLLQAKLAAGAMYSEIARELPGRTKNSCIGRATRMGYHGPIKQPSESKIARIKKALSRAERMVAQRNASPGSQVTTIPADHSDNPVAFMDLSWNHCRWPLSGEGMNTMFCGDPIHTKCESYCFRHFKIATEKVDARQARADYELRRRAMFRARAA